MLFPSNHSSDFEVHRNWMAIVYNKPIGEWYIENTSIWTLDYPIFFAYFEWILARLASLFDEKILTLSSKPYYSTSTLIFQRISVLVMELLFLIPSIQIINRSQKNCDPNSQHNSLFFTVFNASLILVDNMHFQYNCFLIGILLFAILYSNEHPRLSAVIFTFLVFTKHYFLVIAPIWFVYLIHTCCYDSKGSIKNFIYSSMVIFIIVVTVSTIAIFPLLKTNQIFHFFRRLFPVSRGFIHFIPASNIYSIYATLDKILPRFIPKICSTSITDPNGHYIKSMRCLPPISPYFCIVICLAMNIPILIRLFRNLTRGERHISILASSSLSLLISFLFGYHIHEKQIIYATVPLGVYTYIFSKDEKFNNYYLLLNNWANISMMVLHEEYPENIIKYIIVLVYYYAQLIFLKSNSKKYNYHHSFLMLSLISIFIIEFIVQKIVLGNTKFLFVYHLASSLICFFPIAFYSSSLYCLWITRKIEISETGENTIKYKKL
ncbi:hypothetical protein RS030_81329 [Cryptosporidium xiaoi]|uniref:Alpha-1,3-glucosyltransferase n=1 Tax=Cryptosporidium xiaoi TaxID=659607 RepID=A0AAV9XTE5_9CRYT